MVKKCLEQISVYACRMFATWFHKKNIITRKRIPSKTQINRKYGGNKNNQPVYFSHTSTGRGKKWKKSQKIQINLAHWFSWWRWCIHLWNMRRSFIHSKQPPNRYAPSFSLHTHIYVYMYIFISDRCWFANIAVNIKLWHDRMNNSQTTWNGRNEISGDFKSLNVVINRFRIYFVQAQSNFILSELTFVLRTFPFTFITRLICKKSFSLMNRILIQHGGGHSIVSEFDTLFAQQLIK